MLYNCYTHQKQHYCMSSVVQQCGAVLSYLLKAEFSHTQMIPPKSSDPPESLLTCI